MGSRKDIVLLSAKSGKLQAHLKKTSKLGLKMLETRVTDRIAGIKRFSPWPALEQSLAADLEAIWQEQAAREAPQSAQSLK